MTPAIALFIALCAFATSAISGVFGMAGGLLLMGALVWVLPVAAAFVAHGLIQIVANGWRAILHRRHVEWRIVGVYAAGSLIAGLAVAGVAYAPSKPLLYLLLGLIPAVLWLPKDVARLDASKPAHALAGGVLVTGVNLIAGVSGPLLDIFFVRTTLNRHQIVATKAATQVFAHLAKIVVYGAPLLAAGAGGGAFLWPLVFAVPLSIAGTILGGRILDRMTDKGFLTWTRWIVTAVGVGYLAQAARLALEG